MTRSIFKLGVPLFIIAAAVLSGSSAHAQTYYTSLTNLQAAASTNVVATFEGIAPSGGSTNNPDISPLTVTVANSSFSTNNYAVVSGSASGGVFSVNGTDSMRAGLAFNTIPTVTINFGSAITAFGTEIGFGTTSSTFTDSFTLSLYNGASQVGSSYVSGAIQSGFIGATSNVAFDSIKVTTNSSSGAGPYQLYDNVRTNAVSTAVPEAGTVALVLPALGILGAVTVRRRKK